MLEALRPRGGEGGGEEEGFRELLSRTLCALPAPTGPTTKLRSSPTASMRLATLRGSGRASHGVVAHDAWASDDD